MFEVISAEGFAGSYPSEFARSAANSDGRRNTSSLEVSMGTMKQRQRAVQLYRGQIPSPGRPTIAWRQDGAVLGGDRGISSEDPALEIRVSPAVGDGGSALAV